MKKLSLLLLSVICFITCAIGLVACGGDNEDLAYSEFTDPYEKNEYGWDITGYSVKATNKDLSGEIIIPAKYNGQQVIALDDNAFNGCSKVTTITIPEGVTYIGRDAFMNCSSNVTVNIPSSVKTIRCSMTQYTVPKVINYNGTYADWNNIRMTVACYSTNTTVIHFTDGDYELGVFTKK